MNNSTSYNTYSLIQEDMIMNFTDEKVMSMIDYLIFLYSQQENIKIDYRIERKWFKWKK